ncbi:condensation domain-containing protein [Sessilibacter sp. MAH4]
MTLRKFPLTENQMSLWLAQLSDPNSVAYNMVHSLELDISSYKETLQNNHESLITCFNTAFLAVLLENPALRCIYRQNSNTVEQVVQNPDNFETPFYSMELVSLETECVWPHLQQQADHIFNLEEELPCKGILYHSKNDNDRVALQIILHHIAGDFFSCELVFNQLLMHLDKLCSIFNDSTAYHNYLEELLNHSDDAFKKSFFHYQNDESNYRSSESSKIDRGFWHDYLNNSVPLELPLNFIRPSVQTFLGDEIQTQFTKEEIIGIKHVAKALHTTPYIFLFGLFQWLLNQYSCQQNFRIATPVTARTQKNYRKSIGYFVSPIVLNCHVDKSALLIDFVADVQNNLSKTLEHQRYPLRRIIKDCIETGVVEQTSDRTPLFQHMFTYSRIQRHSHRNKVKKHLLSQQRGSAHELNLMVVEDRYGIEPLLEMRWRFNEALYHSKFVKELSDQYRCFINTLIALPEQSLLRTRLADITVPEKFLSIIKASEISFKGAHALNDWLTICLNSRNNLAIKTANQVFSYQELFFNAHAYAQKISKFANKPTIVGICLERSPEAIFAMLGAWLQGVPYLCFDRSLPKQRLELLINQVKPDVLWLDQAVSELPKIQGVDIIHVNELEDISNPDISFEQLVTSAQAQDDFVAYKIFTSGTTGLPKLISVLQSNLSNYVNSIAHANLLPEGNNSTLLSLTSFATDLGHTALFGALLTGRTYVLLNDEQCKDPNFLQDYLSINPVDALKITPSFFSALSDGVPNITPKQRLIFGGEKLTANIVNTVLANESDSSPHVFNHYGPSESTVGIVCGEITKNTRLDEIPLGRALKTSSLAVVDAELNAVPKGVVGELLIAGATLSLGYDDKTLNKGRFIEHPLIGRCYRSGDVVKIDHNDNLIFIGRIDRQIKIRGHRIELDEIDAVLLKWDEIKHVTSAPREGINTTIDTYISFKNAVSLTQLKDKLQRIERFVSNALPEYMLPGYWRIVSEIPRTASGKLDINAVKTLSFVEIPFGQCSDDPNSTIKSDLHSDVIPSNDLVVKHAATKKEDTGKNVYTPDKKIHEKAVRNVVDKLHDIWCEVLQKESIKHNQDFFSLGGDSILSLQIIAKARKQHLKITPKQFFTGKSISGIAELITPKTDIEEVYATKATELNNAKEPKVNQKQYPLTAIQSWFFNQFPTGENFWNQSILICDLPVISYDRLREFVRLTLIKHPQLRARFACENNRWIQFYAPVEDSLITASVQTLSTEYWQDSSNQQYQGFLTGFQATMDITYGPLFKLLQVTDGNEQSKILFTAHHLVIDGVSWRILLEEFDEFFFTDKSTSHINNVVDNTFNDWLTEVQTRSTMLQKLPNHWNPVLHTLTNTQTVTRSLVADARDYQQVFSEDFLLSTKLPERLTVKHYLLASLSKALTLWFDDNPELKKSFTFNNYTVIECENHGRESTHNDIDLSSTVGWFTCRYPVLVPVNTTDSNPLIEQTKLNLPSNNDAIDYGIWRYLHANSTHWNHTPLNHQEPFMVVNYLGKFISQPAGRNYQIIDPLSNTLEGAALHNSRANTSLRAQQLDLNLVSREDGLQVHWSYNPAIFSEVQIIALSQLFKGSLNEFKQFIENNLDDQPQAADFHLTDDEFSSLLEDL